MDLCLSIELVLSALTVLPEMEPRGSSPVNDNEGQY